MITCEEFLKNPQDVLEFRTRYDGVFKKDNRARASLNATLETNYVAVFRTEENYKGQWKKDNIVLSGEQFYIVTAKGKVLYHTNSEWGSIGVAKDD